MHCPNRTFSLITCLLRSTTQIDRYASQEERSNLTQSIMGKHPISQLPWPVTSSTVRSCSRMLKAPQTNRPAPTTGSLPSNEKAHESEPWKHEGYQKFSEWMASDDDLFVFRRFASTNARIILWMQHQINSKEERLSELHNAVVQAPQENNWRNDSFGWDAESLCERDRLMRELSSLVLHYSKSEFHFTYNID